MPTGRPSMRAKPDHEILREMFVHLEEIAIVHHALDHILDVVWQVRFRRHERIQLRIHRGRSGRPYSRRGGSSRLFCGR